MNYFDAVEADKKKKETKLYNVLLFIFIFNVYIERRITNDEIMYFNADVGRQQLQQRFCRWEIKTYEEEMVLK